MPTVMPFPRIDLRDIMRAIPVYSERRKKHIALRRTIDMLLDDLRDGRLSRKSAANLFAFHGLPIERALHLLAGRKPA